jgi:multidrug efflux pump subunit AcrA (membrane-fusion protein)
MSSPSTQPGAAQPSADKAGESGLPDAKRLQSQLASLAENESAGGLRPLVEFLRAMLNVRALGLLPIGEGAAPCVVTTGGILASALAGSVAALDPREAVIFPAPEHAFTIAVPVVREGVPSAWLVAVLGGERARDLQSYLVILQALAGLFLYREQRRVTGQIRWALERTSALLDLFRRAAAEEDTALAVRLAVDGLRDEFGGARVQLGTRRRDGFHVRAISGVTQIDARSPAHQPVEAAMREALLAGGRIDFSAGSPRTAATVAHELLQQQTSAGQITTIPFPKKRGALVLTWTSDAPPDAGVASLVNAAAPLLPALFEVLERARPSPLLFAVRRVWERWTENRRRAAMIAAGAFVVLLGWPFHHAIRADCRLAPTVKRVVAAPFQGTLKRTFVRPGDAVAEGQPLVEMENRDLKLKEGELSAARERALKQRDKAMSNEGEGADFASAQLATLEAQGIGRELDLVQRRLASLQIAAPLAGVIVSGDLRRAEGQPVQQGQVLLEVAPLDEMILEIDVPDREISRVAPGQPVRFRLEAFAGEPVSAAVEKVHPQSEQRDGRNVFIAEAPVHGSGRQLELRPGMRGRAVIQGERRPLVWILGHRLWEFVVETIFW